MALADVYEIRITGGIHSEAWAQVFHALRLNAAFDAQDVLDAFADHTMGDWVECVPDAVHVTLMEVKSIGNPLDFASYAPANMPGLRTGNTLGPHAGPSVKFTRRRTDMHHGYKRLPGIVEGDQDNGVISGALKAIVDDWASTLCEAWEIIANPGTDVANYVVVKRVLDGGVYRLPENDGELVYYAPLTGVCSAYITTQNSRKYGA